MRHRWLPNTNCERQTNATPNLYILRFDLLRMQKAEKPNRRHSLTHTRTRTRTLTRRCLQVRAAKKCRRQQQHEEDNSDNDNDNYNGKCSQCCRQTWRGTECVERKLRVWNARSKQCVCQDGEQKREREVLLRSWWCFDRAGKRERAEAELKGDETAEDEEQQKIMSCSYLWT